MEDPIIRSAVPSEADQLSDLAFRSKAHWGYDDHYLELCRTELVIRPENIQAARVFVLAEEKRILGFYEVREYGKDMYLEWLFLEPDTIGQGYGKCLFHHAVLIVEQLGYQEIYIKSDPNAEGFYLALGAKRAGEEPSSVLEKLMLPLMRYHL